MYGQTEASPRISFVPTRCPCQSWFQLEFQYRAVKHLLQRQNKKLVQVSYYTKVKMFV